MDIRIFSTEQYASIYAAAVVDEVIKSRRSPVLGLATGSSPIPLYQELIRFHSQGLSFSHVTAVNLDEYVGLSPDHHQSYNYFMQSQLFNHIDIPIERTFLPRGNADELEEECKRYDNILRANPRDIQILGIGANGHIGFNEPDSRFKTSTHVVELAPDTIASNSRFFEEGEHVPTEAITMGIQSILAAQQIILIAFGSEKAQAVRDAIHGDVKSSTPASILQVHPNVTFVLDTMAARLL